MKILTICQYYYPEPFRIPDICEELASQGHEVTVITGIPNYPMGKIYKGYEKRKKRDEIINGVNVHRCFTIGRRSGIFFRLLNYYSFSISSSLYIKKIKDEFDFSFVNQLSPVMMASAGVKLKKKYGKKLIIYCLDIWPESLLMGGIKENSLIYRYFLKKSAGIYVSADKILISSKSFSKYFKDKFGIQKTEYFPQYAETVVNVENCAKKADQNFDVMFAGNIGAAQSVDTIIRAAALTRERKNIRWHIVGDGSELNSLRRLSEELHLDNVTFYGRKPLAEMPEYYSIADVMLVTLKRDPIASMTLPGKVQTCMAAGKPIIASADGETRIIIEEAKCGKCCDAEDEQSLSRIVEEFANMKDLGVYAENSRSYYEANFPKERFIESLLKHMGEMC